MITMLGKPTLQEWLKWAEDMQIQESLMLCVAENNNEDAKA